MPTYKTLDFLPDLTPAKMAEADNKKLNFASYTPTSSLIKWDFFAEYYSSQPYALLHDTFSFTAQEGATYDFFSYSYFDPFLIKIYDNLGNVIAVDTEAIGDTYGTDYIWNFVAPYSGKFYVSAGWYQ